MAELISHTAYRTSCDLAVEKGVFPLFDREAYLAGETVSALPDDIRDRIAAGGIRNALLTSIAPTGTIPLFADNVSSGIEPVFAPSDTRKVLIRDGSTFEEEVSDYALRRFREQFGPEALLPEHFITAQDLTPADHIRACRRPCSTTSTAPSRRRSTSPKTRPSKRSRMCIGTLTGVAARAAPPTGPPQSLGRRSRRRRPRGRRRPTQPPNPRRTFLSARRSSPAPRTSCAGPIASTPSTSPSTMSRQTEHGARSRSSSTPRTWSIMRGSWRSPA